LHFHPRLAKSRRIYKAVVTDDQLAIESAVVLDNLHGMALRCDSLSSIVGL
jgi:hypothetical protein